MIYLQWAMQMHNRIMHTQKQMKMPKIQIVSYFNNWCLRFTTKENSINENARKMFLTFYRHFSINVVQPKTFNWKIIIDTDFELIWLNFTKFPLIPLFSLFPLWNLCNVWWFAARLNLIYTCRLHPFAKNNIIHTAVILGIVALTRWDRKINVWSTCWRITTATKKKNTEFQPYLIEENCSIALINNHKPYANSLFSARFYTLHYI